MAKSNCTPGYRIAGSKFSEITETLTPTKPIAVALTGSSTSPGHSPLIACHAMDTHFAELMETLRFHLYEVLRLPFAAQTRSRLVKNYWEVELLVKEMRLILEPSVLCELQAVMDQSP